MARILIGIPSTRDYAPFRESLPVFLEDLKKKHSIRVFEVKDKNRDRAREEIANNFLLGIEDYLLFLDDDHSGHKAEMVDALLKPDEMFVSMKCYARHFPYQLTTCSADKAFQDGSNLTVLKQIKGYSPCHFAGFGMALIKKEAFLKIDAPFFQCDKLGEKEDSYFCKKLLEKGIQPIGCFDYTLTHDGIDESTILETRQDGYKKFVSKQHRKELFRRCVNSMDKNNVKIPDAQRELIEAMDVALNYEVVQTRSR